MGEAVRHIFEAAMQGAGAHEVFERACDYGVDATLYRMADELGLERDAAWRAQWRLHLVETMARRRELCEVYDRLEHALGRVLVLKGEPLAVRLYGDGYARRSGDLDLMCAPAQIEQAWRELISWGCKPLYGARPEPWRYNQWACARPGTGRVIELHWRLCAPEIGAPDFEDLYARSVEVELGEQGSVRTLGDVDQLLGAAYHFHHHMGFFKGLLDVAAWWDRFGDREDLVREAEAIAEQVGVGAMLAWPLDAVARISGARSGVTGSSEAFGAWTAWSVRGALARDQQEGGLLGFKTRGVSQSEVVAWRLLGLVLVRGGMRAGIQVALSSPEQMRQRTGAARVSWAHWRMWLERIVDGVAQITRTGR